MKDNSRKYVPFTRRALITGGVKFFALSIIFGRFVLLQISESKKYKDLSRQNRVRARASLPLRGEIRDRNGLIIAENITTYRAILSRGYELSLAEIAYKLSLLLGYEVDALRFPPSESVLISSLRGEPVVLQDNLCWKDIAKIEEHLDLAGVEVEVLGKRFYPEGSLTGHITGYVSKPSNDDIKNMFIPNYSVALVGKQGVERNYDFELHGIPEVKEIEVNVSGRFVRDLNVIPGTGGQVLPLSIDLRMQKAVSERMSKITGAAVIMDPYTGEILSIYSTPSYDPNKFIGGIGAKDWKGFAEDQHKPLINKAIASLYPPGSTFKLVTALAILCGGINPEEEVRCTGEHRVGNRVFHCWKRGGHGYVNMTSAIAKTCNIYFYVQGIKSGIDNLFKIATLLGFGQKTGIDLPFENGGLMPNKEWKVSRFKQKWSVGDTANSTIGQGYVLVTPLQLATALSRIVSGARVVPHLGILDKNNESSVPIAVPSKHLDLVKKGMYLACNLPGGTCYGQYDRLELVGKTGTAQVISNRSGSLEGGKKEHALFIGFAPYTAPRYAIAVVVEHGGWGSKGALPIAKRILGDISDW